MAAQPYDGSGSHSPQWWPSRYGPEDRIGAANELTAERTRAALGLPREGRVVELGRLLEPGIPAYPPRSWSQLILAHQSLIQWSPEGSQMTAFEEQVSQTYQIGTHLDGLGHVGIAGRFYNGLHYEEFYSPTALTQLGIDTARPWVSRGVCLDIAAVEGTERLDAGFVIRPEHLEEAERRQGVEVHAGDAVLLHTGWGDLWNVDNDTYGAQEPGAGWDASHWLTERRVSCVGADNWAFEVLPFEQEDRPFICHQHLLAETGTYILENPMTRPLVAGQHWEYLFVMAPNKTLGSTASMVAPIAVV